MLMKNRTIDFFFNLIDCYRDTISILKKNFSFNIHKLMTHEAKI